MLNEEIIDELERNGNVVYSILIGLSSDAVRWRPQPEKWNLLDVVSHLVDEEKEVFRARVESVLNDPIQELTPINPEDWVSSRKYQDNDFESKLAEFMAERKKSVDWLRNLEDPKWDNAFQHSHFGLMSAQLFLENWLAHDLLHIRQILGIKFGYLKLNAKNPLQYAGDW